MVVNRDWEKKIFNLWKNRNFHLAKKEVSRFRMQYYNELEDIEDKISIDYRMAYLEYLDKNIDLANVYLKNLRHIFNDEYVRDSCLYEYYKYRWLYINTNESTLTKEEIILSMMQIYNYYNEIGNEKMMRMAYGNILKFKGDGIGLLDTLRYILESDVDVQIIFLNSILMDCEKINHNLYIRALDMIDSYKIDINAIGLNIDIV